MADLKKWAGKRAKGGSMEGTIAGSGGVGGGVGWDTTNPPHHAPAPKPKSSRGGTEGGIGSSIAGAPHAGKFRVQDASLAASSKIVQDDRRESKGRHWNPNAMGLRLERLHEAEQHTAEKLGAKSYEEIKHRHDDEAHGAFKEALSKGFAGGTDAKLHKAIDSAKNKRSGGTTIAHTQTAGDLLANVDAARNPKPGRGGKHVNESGEPHPKTVAQSASTAAFHATDRAVASKRGSGDSWEESRANQIKAHATAADAHAAASKAHAEAAKTASGTEPGPGTHPSMKSYHEEKAAMHAKQSDAAASESVRLGGSASAPKEDRDYSKIKTSGHWDASSTLAKLDAVKKMGDDNAAGKGGRFGVEPVAEYKDEAGRKAHEASKYAESSGPKSISDKQVAHKVAGQAHLAAAKAWSEDTSTATKSAYVDFHKGRAEYHAKEAAGDWDESKHPRDEQGKFA